MLCLAFSIVEWGARCAPQSARRRPYGWAEAHLAAWAVETDQIQRPTALGGGALFIDAPPRR